jgi:hypothetical protein
MTACRAGNKLQVRNNAEGENSEINNYLRESLNSDEIKEREESLSWRG